MKKIILIIILFLFKVEAKAVTFTVKDFYGNQKEYDYISDMKIEKLKNTIKKDFNILRSNQKLYLNGFMLENEKPLSYYRLDQNKTIYILNKEDNNCYPIKVNIKGNGKINVLNKACVSDFVYVSVIPDKGYNLKSFKIKDFEGNLIKYEDFRFSMPFGIVSIEGEFRKDKEVIIKPVFKENENIVNKSDKNYNLAFLIFSLSTILSLSLKKWYVKKF